MIAEAVWLKTFNESEIFWRSEIKFDKFPIEKIILLDGSYNDWTIVEISLSTWIKFVLDSVKFWNSGYVVFLVNKENIIKNDMFFLYSKEFKFWICYVKFIQSFFVYMVRFSINRIEIYNFFNFEYKLFQFFWIKS